MMPAAPAPPVSPAVRATVEGHIRAWLEAFVVGLNLCPFARPLLGAPNLRIAVCESAQAVARRRAFLEELDLLQASTEEAIATTLLVLPLGLEEFEDYLDYLDECQQLLEESGLEGVVQLASFHPHYQFAGEAAGAASHYSNRAPYPVIHLLRENMLTRALEGFDQPERIPANNIHTLEQLGVGELESRWLALFSPPAKGD
jgi:hypothetical protein